MLSEYILDIVKPQLSFCKVFIHFTDDKSIARDILHDGFGYSDYFLNSSIEISLDLIDIRYKYGLYKAYGDFLVIICIPLSHFNYFPLMESKSKHDVLYNLGLCEDLPTNELEYLLKNTYVYGFIDLQEPEFHLNDHFGK
jgi:hypothetical protein